MLSILPSQTHAQGWLDEAKEAARSAAETAEDAVQKANPEEVILQKFGSNPTLERGAERIRGALSQLEDVASTPPLLRHRSNIHPGTEIRVILVGLEYFDQIIKRVSS